MNISTIFAFLASLCWLFVVVMIGVVVMRSARQLPNKGLMPLLIGAIIGALVLSTVGAGVVFIEPDQLAVIITVA